MAQGSHGADSITCAAADLLNVMLTIIRQERTLICT